MEQRANLWWRMLRNLWRGIDLLRRLVLNLVFFGCLLVLLGWWLVDAAPEAPESAILVLDPRGELVEQKTGDPLEQAFRTASGDDLPEVSIWDLMTAVEEAAEDPRIVALHLDLRGLFWGELSKLQDLRDSIDTFAATGKPVIASSDLFSKGQYLLAAGADEIHLDPMGMVMLDGFGVFRSYHREGLDRLEIDWNVFRVGEFKSAVEPYLRNSMSEEARAANRDWLCDLWIDYLDAVASSRGLDAGRIAAAIDDLPRELEISGNDGAALARRLGLVDHLSDHLQLRARLAELAGVEGDEEPEQIAYAEYLELLDAERLGRSTDEGSNPDAGDVAIVVARGMILPGHRPPGTIGGDSTADLVRRARKDPEVKALVLRVDSGGGSALASEVIRRELEAFRDAGKPVVVSMGSVAASGGYWIATASDEIWASPTTLTGSIGIYGMLPTYQKPLARYLGTRVDGVGTTWLSGAYRPDRSLDPDLAETMQRMIEATYRTFLERVAEARGMTPEMVDSVARGRVWSGEDALDLGLVDALGGLEDAIVSAERLAGLAEGEAGVRWIEPEVDEFDQLVADLLARAVGERWPRVVQRLPSAMERLLAGLEPSGEALARLEDPMGIYAHCDCEVE